MSIAIHQCIERVTKIRLSLGERSSKVTIVNDKKHLLCKVQVDGCVFTDRDPMKRCDYLVNVEDLKWSIFIELKGSSIDAALEQLTASHALLAEHRLPLVTWIISCRSFPKTTPKMQKRMADIRKIPEMKSLVVKNGPIDFNLETGRSVG